MIGANRGILISSNSSKCERDYKYYVFLITSANQRVLYPVKLSAVRRFLCVFLFYDNVTVERTGLFLCPWFTFMKILLRCPVKQWSLATDKIFLIDLTGHQRPWLVRLECWFELCVFVVSSISLLYPIFSRNKFIDCFICREWFIVECWACVNFYCFFEVTKLAETAHYIYS